MNDVEIITKGAPYYNLPEFKKEKKAVYITGCCGFIGSHVTQACLDQGWYVYGIDKMTYAGNDRVMCEFYDKYEDQWTFERKDINDIDFLYECDYIINLAAETHVDNSIVNSDDFVKSNINGVHHILKLIQNYKSSATRRKPILIQFSTDETYSDIEAGSHKETDLLKPSNPYAATKAAADQLILSFGRTYNLPYNILRPTNNYGVNQYVEKLIPKVCKSLIMGKKIPLHNNGTPIRTWLNAKDTARAVLYVIYTNQLNQIFNVSGNLELKNIDVVKKIFREWESQTGTELKDEEHVDFSFSRPGQDVRYSIDDTKLRSIGWNTICNFDEELKEIVDYYRNVGYIW